MIVPRDLREAVGKRVIKISLRTRDARVAKAYAYAYGAQYAATFAAYRAECMPKPPSLDEIVRAAQGGGVRNYELALPSGVRIRAEGADDHSRAMEALALVLRQGPTTPSRSHLEASTTVPSTQAISLSEGAHKYLLTLEGRSIPDKTRSQKKAAVMGFVKWKGGRIVTNRITRADVSAWVQSLSSGALSTPTIVNKCSYLSGFFAWAQGAGYFPSGDNPATGHIKYSMAEKRKRRNLGFSAFTPEQLRRIYSPAALSCLPEDARWGALIGLYTGARVSEVGQIRLDDFFYEDEVWCVRITDEGPGQSLKTEVSNRAIPVHPALIERGLCDRVELLRQKGESQLFPRAKAGSVNGMGNWLSKAFGRHLLAMGVTPERKSKIGFHSLRKTFIQALQDIGMSSEARAQLVGHELDDEHHTVYSRRYSCGELFHGSGLNPGLALLNYGANG